MFTLDLHGYGPDEAEELATDGAHDFGMRFAAQRTPREPHARVCVAIRPAAPREVPMLVQSEISPGCPQVKFHLSP